MDYFKNTLVNKLKKAGAFDVRIADPHQGFEHAYKHPLKLWPECNSIIVFAIANPHKFNDTYISVYSPWNGDRGLGPVPEYFRSELHATYRLGLLLSATVTLKGVAHLTDHGHKVSFAGIEQGLPSIPQLKIMAFEAGIGVYGRSGLIIHPILGNRMVLGAILTDAKLQSDAKLGDFDPCNSCDLCVKSCPGDAFDKNKCYPESWSYEKCESARTKLKLKRKYCNNCFMACPAGKIPDKDLYSVQEADNLYYSVRSAKSNHTI